MSRHHGRRTRGAPLDASGTVKVRFLTAIFAAAVALGCAEPTPIPPAAPLQPAPLPEPLPGPRDLSGRRLQAGYDGYQFVMFGSFGSVSAVIVERSAEGAAVQVISVVGRRDFSISSARWDALVVELERIGFWSMAEEEATPGPSTRDGTVWRIEALREGKRHRVVRKNPDVNPHQRGLDDFLAACQMMVNTGEIRCGSAGCLPLDFSNAPRPAASP